MKKFIAILSLLLAPVGCKAASTDTIKVARTKTVELHSYRTALKAEDTRKTKKRIENLEGYGICAGAIVSNSGDILTAQHCVDGTSQITVKYGDLEYRAVVRAVSKMHDLALIHIDAFNTPYFQLARSVEQGQTVFVLGSPLGITGTFSKGTVAKLAGDVNLLDCGVLPGNSGGPVLNEDGQLLGIATAGFIVLYGTTHLNVMQSLEAIIGFGVFGN